VIKKQITYTDFDGNEVTEDHYFHLSKSELIEMELTADGGLAETLKKMVAEGNFKQILTTFKDVIAAGYGVRDASDARRFRKSKEKTDEFLDSLAFDAMYMELMTSPTAAAEFVNGMVPTDISSNPEVIKALADAVPDAEELAASAVRRVNEPAAPSLPDSRSGLGDPRDSAGSLLPWAFRAPSQNELVKMNKTQLLQVMARQNSDWSPPGQ
jgi:hypothetical protein